MIHPRATILTLMITAWPLLAGCEQPVDVPAPLEVACERDEDCARNHACETGACTFVKPDCQPEWLSYNYGVDAPMSFCREPCGGTIGGDTSTWTYDGGRLVEWGDGFQRSAFTYDERGQRETADVFFPDPTLLYSERYEYSDIGLLARISLDDTTVEFERNEDGDIVGQGFFLSGDPVRTATWSYEEGLLRGIDSFDAAGAPLVRELFVRDDDGNVASYQRDVDPDGVADEVFDYLYDADGNVIRASLAVADLVFVDTWEYGTCDVGG